MGAHTAVEMVTSAGCRMLEEGVTVTRLRVDIGHLHLGSALEDPDTRSAEHTRIYANQPAHPL